MGDGLEQSRVDYHPSNHRGRNQVSIDSLFKFIANGGMLNGRDVKTAGEALVVKYEDDVAEAAFEQKRQVTAERYAGLTAEVGIA